MGSCTDPSFLTRAECLPSLETPAPLPPPSLLPSGDTPPASHHRHLALALPPPPSPPPSQLSPPLAAASRPPLPRPLPPSPQPEGVGDVAGVEEGNNLGFVAPPLTTTLPSGDLAEENISRRGGSGGLLSQGGSLPYGHTHRARRSLRGGGGDKSGGDQSDLEVQWLNPAWGSFDNVFDAMLVLYVASTGDGWEDFMWAGMDATAVDMAPVRNDASLAAFFFIAWMIVGCFVAINLFVGAPMTALHCNPCALEERRRHPRVSLQVATPCLPYASRCDRRQLHAHQEGDRRLRLDDARAEAVGRLDARLALRLGACAARTHAPAAARLLPTGALAAL